MATGTKATCLLAGPRTHAFWLGSSVFDGARAFEGVTPGLDRHCERLNASAHALGLKPTQSVAAIMDLVKHGLERFRSQDAIYIRPCIGRRTAASAALPYRRIRKPHDSSCVFTFLP